VPVRSSVAFAHPAGEQGGRLLGAGQAVADHGGRVGWGDHDRRFLAQLRVSDALDQLGGDLFNEGIADVPAFADGVQASLTLGQRAPGGVVFGGTGGG
jgi:hypothetical protein